MGHAANLSGDTGYQATLLSLAEMIKSGTTCFCDMYLYAGDVTRAAAESGLRAWINEAVYHFPSPNYGQVSAGFEYMAELFAGYSGHPFITVTGHPHAVYLFAGTVGKIERHNGRS